MVHHSKETGSFVTLLRTNHGFHVKFLSSDGKRSLIVVGSWAGPTRSDSSNFNLINLEMNLGFPCGFPY